jgi:hypothetical protein
MPIQCARPNDWDVGQLVVKPKIVEDAGVQ